jgi:hypothetical protein
MAFSMIVALIALAGVVFGHVRSRATSNLRAFDRIRAEQDVDPAQAQVIESAYARWRAQGDEGGAVWGTLGTWLVTMLMVRRTSGTSAVDPSEATWPSLQPRPNDPSRRAEGGLEQLWKARVKGPCQPVPRARDRLSGWKGLDRGRATAGGDAG